MEIDDLIRKYNVEIATIENDYKKWVYTTAQKVNLQGRAEKELVMNLSWILANLMLRNKWAGISSNNIYWTGSDIPFKVIIVPEPKTKSYLTIINPEIKELYGNEYESIEGCGSIPNKTYRVERKPYVYLVGNVLDGSDVKRIKLEYGSKKQDYNDQKGLERDFISMMTLSVVQHECDHLDGRLLIDQGIQIK